jgi:DnaK suppressor protein
MSEMNESVKDELRDRLEEEKLSLQRQLADYGASGDGIDVALGEGFADSGQATAERTEALGIVETLRSQLIEVMAALARMEKGTYGRCENCGQEIPEARLEAVPSARYCVSCKQGR